MSLFSQNAFFSISEPYKLHISFVNHRNRIQNTYNLLIIILADDGSWPLAANFTLVSRKFVIACFLIKSFSSVDIRFSKSICSKNTDELLDECRRV